jgi:hypothetical protein
MIVAALRAATIMNRAGHGGRAGPGAREPGAGPGCGGRECAAAGVRGGGGARGRG